MLFDGSLPAWDSLASGEHPAEAVPHRGFWPRDPAAGAQARCVSAEMHAGYANLRARMPMNVRASQPGGGRTPQVLTDVARVLAIWRQGLGRHGRPFLCGEYSHADAMYAPVVTRFSTYRVALDGACRAYAERIQAPPAMQAWRSDAIAEAQVIEAYELPN